MHPGPPLSLAPRLLFVYFASVRLARAGRVLSPQSPISGRRLSPLVEPVPFVSYFLKCAIEGVRPYAVTLYNPPLFSRGGEYTHIVCSLDAPRASDLRLSDTAAISEIYCCTFMSKILTAYEVEPTLAWVL